jgi:hypothetical protein
VAVEVAALDQDSVWAGASPEAVAPERAGPAVEALARADQAEQVVALAAALTLEICGVAEAEAPGPAVGVLAAARVDRVEEAEALGASDLAELVVQAALEPELAAESAVRAAAVVALEVAGPGAEAEVAHREVLPGPLALPASGLLLRRYYRAERVGPAGAPGKRVHIP